MGLNKAQQEAVTHFEGPCMVLAGPGSGKTLTIAKRIEYLISRYQVRPEEILVITFTREASYEMQQRFLYITEGHRMPVTFGTFHGIYYGILKWAYGFGPGSVLGEEEKYQILYTVLSSLQLDLEVEDEKECIQELIAEIGIVKNNGIEIEYYESEKQGTQFKKIYLEYEKERKKRRKVDFDDMLILCLRLFQTQPDILKQWQDKFRYILVDEFQDVNQVQYEVLKLLALPENNIFVVGDDDQAIYRFRGADPAIMLGFPQDYKNVKKVVLDVNYRSAGYIVSGAQKVIRHNEKRYKKKIQAQQKDGNCIHVQEVKDVLEESHYVVKKIKEANDQGVEFQQMAVLFRTSMDVIVLAETLMEYNIPFSMKERLQNIYEHFIARNLNSYLSIADGLMDRRYFLDIMNCPLRYLARDSMEENVISFEKLRIFYEDKEWMLDRVDQFEWDIKMIKNKTPFAAIQYIRKKIGYDEYIKEYAQKRHLKEEDLFSILQQIEDRAAVFKTTEEWFEYIKEYTRLLKGREASVKKEEKGVALMTMHKAKGLEYDTVFVIQGNEGVIPYKKAKVMEELEEERRMFYVAMTRAKRKLIISYVKTKNGKALSPSRFVEELLVGI